MTPAAPALRDRKRRTKAAVRMAASRRRWSFRVRTVMISHDGRGTMGRPAHTSPPTSRRPPMSALRLGMFVALLAFFAATAAAQEKKNELSPGVRAVLDKAASVELLSLDPDGVAEGDKVPEKDRFH